VQSGRVGRESSLVGEPASGGREDRPTSFCREETSIRNADAFMGLFILGFLFGGFFFILLGGGWVEIEWDRMGCVAKWYRITSVFIPSFHSYDSIILFILGLLHIFCFFGISSSSLHLPTPYYSYNIHEDLHFTFSSPLPESQSNHRFIFSVVCCTPDSSSSPLLSSSPVILIIASFYTRSQETFWTSFS